MADLGLSAGAMCDLIETMIGNDADNAAPGAGVALAYLNAGYWEFLRGQDPRTNKVYEWSFLRPRYVLTLAEHVTGTSTGVYDDSTYTTVTATANKFVPTMVGGVVSFADVTGTFTVYSYTSETVIVVTGDATHADKTFTIDSGGVYNLPDDFGGFLGPPVYVYDSADARGPLTESSAGTIRTQYYRDGYSQSTPEHYAIIPRTFAVTTGERFDLLVGPPPDSDRDVIFPYRRLADAMTDSGTVFPVGGVEHAYTILAYGKKHLEQTRGVFDGPWGAESARRMIASIDIDKRLFGSGNRPLTLNWNTGLG